MLAELSLHVLDIAENSVRAGAKLIQIRVAVDEAADRISIAIEDDGCGMSEEQLARVQDPFYTSRTTRKVGLGIPFFKEAALLSGGDFSMQSAQGRGTLVEAVFGLSNIDRMPMGDIDTSIHNLIVYHTDIDFLYTYQFNGRMFSLDTRELRELLGDVPFDTPEVSLFLKEYLSEQRRETDGGVQL